MPYIDLAFRLTGNKVPVDHGYVLYSEISGLVPEIDEAKKIGVQAELAVGERRTLRVKDKQVVGFELAATGLSTEDSLRLQETGIGGRRHMGCGIFARRHLTK